MSSIRVLVVENSVPVRQRLVEILMADPQIQVVGEAGDGGAAVDLCRQLRPHVVTTDMRLPVLDGLAVTERIMAICPTPILIVSSPSDHGELYSTYDALTAGALDVLDKPNGGDVEGEWARAFLATIKMVSKIKVITHLRGRLYRRAQEPQLEVPERYSPYRLVTIGASTGGPAAVAEILRNLPADFPIPILILIHIAEPFGRLLEEWLDKQSLLRVSYAVDREDLPEAGHGRVLLAPPGHHVVLSANQVHLTNQEPRNSCRPSVDVLFESVAREIGAQSIACLLTGMGRDGAQGLLAIRWAGGRTLAQDEATSTIFGMPQEAIRIGAAERVVGLHEVASSLVALTSSKGVRMRVSNDRLRPGGGPRS